MYLARDAGGKSDSLQPATEAFVASVVAGGMIAGEETAALIKMG